MTGRPGTRVLRFFYASPLALVLFAALFLACNGGGGSKKVVTDTASEETSADTGDDSTTTTDTVETGEPDVPETDTVAETSIDTTDLPIETEDDPPDDTPDTQEPDPNLEAAGGVVVYEVRAPANAVNLGNAGAGFGDPFQEPEPIAEYELCVVARPEQGSSNAYSAGVIEVTVGDGEPITLTPSPSAAYGSSLPEANSEVMAPGDVIHITAAGGELLPFEGSVTAPEDITITSAIFGFGVEVPSNEDLEITWTGSGGEGIAITIVPSDMMGQPTPNAPVITCVRNSFSSF